MPKMKTHKGTAKRFTFTGSGKLVSAMGRRGHFRRRKSTRLLQKFEPDARSPRDDASPRIAWFAVPQEAVPADECPSEAVC
jgi:large subunit ribosomal protein L35